MARSHDDTDWSRAREPWQRLGWARRTHGRFAAAADFARAVKMPDNTYRAYERDPSSGSKSIALDYGYAVRWADLLDVRWQWLLNGQGLPWRDDEPAEPLPEAAEAAEIISAEPDETERRRMVEMLRLMKRTGTSG